MMHFLIFLIISIIVTASADDVIDLTTYSVSDFENEMKNRDLVLVTFLASWCPLSQSFLIEYEKAATELKSNDPPIPLFKVVCSTDLGKDKCDKFGIRRYVISKKR